MPILLFQTEALWEMNSSNAQAWNATLNCTSTFGFNIIPVLMLVIVGFVILGVVSTFRGFG